VARLTKRAVAAGASQGAADLAAALAECERIYLEELAATADMEEGIAAFLDKRPPAWKHR
jgi:enoyl-CoA hydratase/carnithine racemase